jgi:hypothetical protein
MGRGSDESRRGLALGLAFGAGPLLAVLGSLGQTALLGGDLFGWHFDGLAYPRNFIILFAAGVPVMGLAAVVSQLFVIQPVCPGAAPRTAFGGQGTAGWNSADACFDCIHAYC